MMIRRLVLLGRPNFRANPLSPPYGFIRVSPIRHAAASPLTRSTRPFTTFSRSQFSSIVNKSSMPEPLQLEASCHCGEIQFKSSSAIAIANDQSQVEDAISIHVVLLLYLPKDEWKRRLRYQHHG